MFIKICKDKKLIVYKAKKMNIFILIDVKIVRVLIE